MTRRAAWALRVAAGLILFWIAFRDVDPRALGRAFAVVSPAWLALSVVTVFLTVGLIVVRWRALIGTAAGARSTRVLFAAVIASQVANIVTPFKLGDAVRIGAVSRCLRLPPAEILASVAVERVYDAAIVALTAALLASAGVLPPFAFAGMLSLSVTMTAGLAVLASLFIWPEAHRRFRGLITALAPRRVRARFEVELDRLARGVERTSRRSTMGAAAALSACVMAGSILTAFLVATAFDLGIPVVAAAVLVIVLQIGYAVVPVPGAIGVAQVLTVQTLLLWHVDEAPALAFALVLYLVSRVPKLLVLPWAVSALSDSPEGSS